MNFSSEDGIVQHHYVLHQDKILQFFNYPIGTASVLSP